MDQANLDGKRSPVVARARSPKLVSEIRRYSFAFLVVVLAIGVSLLVNVEGFASGHAEITPFLFALAIAGWYGGKGPGIFALVLACFGFHFFFTEPRYTLDVVPADIPYLIIFAVFGGLAIWFSTVRRRVERDLRHARDNLEKRSAELAASNKELEAFAYSVSHDLRAPLRHMAGFSELLQKNSAHVLDDKSKRYVAVILESAKKWVRSSMTFCPFPESAGLRPIRPPSIWDNWWKKLWPKFDVTLAIARLFGRSTSYRPLMETGQCYGWLW
jgi:K+-sensing histidine kinase KdpD